MSVFLRMLNQRLLWVCPAAVMASWLAIRTLGASPEVPLQASSFLSTPVASAQVEIRDAALARMIGRFAAAARALPAADR